MTSNWTSSTSTTWSLDHAVEVVDLQLDVVDLHMEVADLQLELSDLQKGLSVHEVADREGARRLSRHNVARLV